MIVIHNKKTEPTIDGIYIGRPYVLGNPFSHKEKSIAKYKVKSRDEAVDEYEKWLDEKLKDSESEEYKEFCRLLELYKSNKRLDLICWCHPLRCHGDVLAKRLNECMLKEYFKFE